MIQPRFAPGVWTVKERQSSSSVICRDLKPSPRREEDAGPAALGFSCPPLTGRTLALQAAK